MKTFSLTKVIAITAFVATLLPTSATAQETKPRKANLFTLSDKRIHAGFSVGWVSKDWKTKMNGVTLREDLWGNPSKRLNGVQFGLNFNQTLIYGLGWRTGFYYEWYISHDKFLKENGWDRFNEHSLYIPLQIQFRIPLSRNYRISINPYGGIGFNIAMVGRMKNGPMTNASGVKRIDHGYRNSYSGNFLGDLIGEIIEAASGSWTEFQYYDVQKYIYDNHTPRKFNLQAELGVALHLRALQLTFTYSWGLTDHRLYDLYPSRQDKLALNLGLNF